MKTFYSLFLLCGLGLTAHAQIDSVAHHLKEVVVLGHDARTDNLLTPQTGGVVIKGTAIANMPVMLGEPDVLKALQTQTGVSSGIEGFTGIYVRGGENDQNLYLLHRLPLYNVNHLGGLFSSFNVAMVENVKFFKAGFPAEYGGRVASVTDIQLKRSDFEEYHGQASIGLLSGNVHVTGPIIEDRLAFSASVRRSWMELVTIPALAIINSSKKKNGEKAIGGYSFFDINLKLDYNISDYLDGFTHFYMGRDRTKLGSENFSSGDNSYLEKNTIKLNWGSLGAVTCLNFKPNDMFLVSADAYMTFFDSKYKQNADETYGDSYVYSYKNDNSGIKDFGASLRASLMPADNIKIDVGAEFVRHKYKPEELEISGSNGFGIATPTGTAAEIAGNEFVVWENNTFAPFEWLQLSVGARFTQYSSSGRNHKYLEPRGNIRVSLTTYEIHFSNDASARRYYFAKIGAVDYISQVGTLDYSADPTFRLTSERINKTFASLKLEGQNGMPFSNEAMQDGDCCIRITEKGDYTYYNMGENAQLRKVTLYSISEAYYKYLISVLSNDSESSWQGGLTDIGLSEPVRIFSNINGGCGIFGCLHSDKKIVKLPNVRE